MGYLSDILKNEYSNLEVRDIYSSRLGDTEVEILEVESGDEKFIAMFQSIPVKEGIHRWSLIVTSAHNTRTIKGMDSLEGIKLALRSSVDAMIAGIKGK